MLSQHKLIVVVNRNNLLTSTLPDFSISVFGT